MSELIWVRGGAVSSSPDAFFHSWQAHPAGTHTSGKCGNTAEEGRGEARRHTRTHIMFASLLRRSLAALAPPPPSRSPTAAALLLVQPSRWMGVLKSPAVQRWVGERAIEHPTAWRPWRWTNGKWRGPELSRREQAHRAKEAIRRGEVKLEPTVMVPPPKFKGHKRVQRAENRRAIVAQKMAEMPKLIAEYRAERLAKRAKLRAMNRWK